MNFSNYEQSILIVDDEKSNRNILTELLSPVARIILAKNGEQALKKALQHKPDLILLDIIMPDIDGFEVMTSLQSHPETQHISVIFITGFHDEFAEEEGLSLGARDYVTKPFSNAIVMARVKTQLELKKKEHQLHLLANTDILTGINNRRQYETLFEKEWNRCWRSQKPLSYLLIDIDYFKKYNDSLGHSAGDETLTKVAECLESSLDRPADFVARYGGEEFVIILPESDLTAAEHVSKKLCDNIFNMKIEHPKSPHKFITISIGATSTIPSEEFNKNKLLNKADDLLYGAKDKGRNQYICG
ncbi:MAG: diguanylate cyclase [Kordiimonadaceae bacterium]|jgi:diguanylate cyclase (GGDEF)-like protein|nr:diguanylate cyclase [Kordiimonadaceae bacterium]MBT6033886.1 diguanylate cyclase [Kordiimonadaceae bacterium]